MVPRVGAHQAHVAAGRREIVRLGEVFARDLKERRRNFDAHDLRKRIFAREHHRAAHARTGVDEGRRPNHRVGKMRDQTAKRGHGHGFVMRRVRARIAGRLGIEIAKEYDRVRRHAMVAVESSSGRTLRLGHTF